MKPRPAAILRAAASYMPVLAARWLSKISWRRPNPYLERGLALGGLEEAQVKARFALARLLLAQGKLKQLPDM